MPELRRDPIAGRWVIVASERAMRPRDFLSEKHIPHTDACPFCPGREDQTPPEILAYRQEGTAPNSEGWSLRVVPNLFPTLRIEGGMDSASHGMFEKMNGIGAHEVIIETPEHDTSLADLGEKQVADVIRCYRDRSADLRRDPRFKYAMIFRNHGENAGASLEHPHSQLIATPVVPKRVQEEMRGARSYHERQARCVFCDMISQEKESGDRVVVENDDFVVIAPFASRFPFETWLLPRQHNGDFSSITEAGISSCAWILREILKRTKRSLDDAPYNFIIHALPLQDRTDEEVYHWHIEIMPRLTRVAGFEWGSGFYVNPTPPEHAAHYLRDA